MAGLVSLAASAPVSTANRPRSVAELAACGQVGRGKTSLV